MKKYPLPLNTLKLNDLPESSESVSASYLNMVMGMFLRLLVKVYAPEELTEESKAKMRKYLERLFEAREAIDGKEPKGGFYAKRD